MNNLQYDCFLKWLKKKTAYMMTIKCILMHAYSKTSRGFGQKNKKKFSCQNKIKREEEIPVFSYSFAYGIDVSIQSLAMSQLYIISIIGEYLLIIPIVASPLLMRGILDDTPRNSPARPVTLVRGEEVVPVEEQIVHHKFMNCGWTFVDQEYATKNKNKQSR